MLRKLLFAIAMLLLTVVAAFAGSGKERSGSTALTTCGSCAYVVTDATVARGNAYWSHTLSTHTVQFEAPGKSISNIEFTMFIPRAEAVRTNETVLFTDYISLTKDSLQTDSGVWFYYQWVRTDDYDSFEVLTDLLQFTFKSTECVDPAVGLPIRIRDNTAAGFGNTLVEQTEGTVVPGSLTDGHRYYLDPVADLTAWPPGAASNQIVASAVRGAQIVVPLYLREINFEYLEGMDFYVGYDTANLSFVQFNPNANYAWNSSCVDEDSLLHVTSENTFAWQIPTGDVVLGWFYFDIDDDASLGSNHEVWVQGDAEFTSGCQYSYYTSNNTSEKALVEVVEDAAVWKVQKRSLCNSSTPGQFTLDFYVLTNQYIRTDAPNTEIKAAFAFDTTNLGNMEFVGVNDFSYGGGTMNWQFSPDGDYIRIQEDPNTPSPAIVPSTGYQKVGELVFDVEDLNGTYNVVIETAASMTYMYTNVTNQLLTVANGKLDTDDGYILVKSCTLPPPGGCPAVYSWNGDEYVMEDFVLTHSQRQARPHAESDYLPLKADLQAVGGFYNVQIREFEHEKTFLDQVELIAVDYPIASTVGISEEGKIFTHQRWLEPVAAVDQDGNDVLFLVGAEDGQRYVDEGEGSLKLTFANPYAGKGGGRMGFPMATESKPPPPRGSSVDTPEWSGITAEIQDLSGDWHYLGISQPRDYTFDGSNWVFDDPGVEFGSEVNIRISWIDGFNADVQRLLVDDGAEIVTHNITPEVAEHSALGKSVGAVANSDQDVVTLEPGETIDLRFAALDQPAAGFTRSYFLKTYGYYIAANNLPTDFALNQNYPNPFNPTTTISFALPKAADVTLAVYNLLGQEITTLVNEHMEAGTHEVVWPGTDRDGNSVASGVYFYRLTAGEYTASKKMTLVK